MALLWIILVALVPFSHSEITEPFGDPSYNNVDPDKIESFRDYRLQACKDLAGGAVGDASASATRTDLYSLAKDAAANVAKTNVDTTTYMWNCLQGGMPNCAGNKDRFLAENRTRLQQMRENAFWIQLDEIAKQNPYFNLQIALSNSPKLRFGGGTPNVEPLTAQERQPIDALLNSKGATAASLKAFVSDRRKTAVENQKIAIAEFPWLAKHTSTAIDNSKITAGMKTQMDLAIQRQKEVNAMTPAQSRSLIGYPELIDGVILKQSDPAKKAAFCSVAERDLRIQSNREVLKTIGLASAGLMGLALCPFTSGLTCMAVAGMGGLAEGAYVANTYQNYQKAKKDFASGLIDSKQYLQTQEAFRNEVSMAALAGAGSAAAGVKGAAKAWRSSANAREAFGNYLRGNARRNAAAYMDHNPKGGAELDDLYANINRINGSKPGQIPDEVMSRIQGITTRAIGDLSHNHRLRMVGDVNALVKIMEKSPKGSTAYNDALKNIKTRLDVMELILDGTKPGTMLARVQEATKGFPPKWQEAMGRCLLHEENLQRASLDHLIFSKAYASKPVLQSGCDQAISKILEKQGFRKMPDGTEKRELIQDWTCDHCSAENPAWVRVVLDNDEEDLAKVIRCPSCGAPLTSNSPYHNPHHWRTRASDNQIINVEEDEIVRGEKSQATAGKAHASKDKPEFCAFCDTKTPLVNGQCPSCGARSIRHLSRHAPEEEHPPEVPQVNSAGDETSQPSRPRATTSSRRQASGPSDAVGSRSGGPSDATGGRRGGPSDATGGGRSAGKTAAMVAGGAAVAAGAGYAGYQLFRSEEVKAQVTSMNWVHKIVVEKLIPVKYRDWVSDFPIGARTVAGTCNLELHHMEPYQCGTKIENYTIPGSPRHCDNVANNGIVEEVCTDAVPDKPATRTVPKMCERPINAQKCDYLIDEWVFAYEKKESGTVPNGNGPLPWPNVKTGTNERQTPYPSYSVNFAFDAFGEARQSAFNPGNETEFKSWRPGQQATGKFSRGRGIYDLSH